MAKSTVSTYKKNVWKSCARYIKIRDCDHNGVVACCTCGNAMLWDDQNCNAGHFIGGRKNNVLFDETIIHPQCVYCNKYNGGRPWDYEQFMMKRYGYDYATLEEIKARRNVTKKYEMDELKALKEHFDSEFERIKKEKGL